MDRSGDPSYGESAQLLNSAAKGVAIAKWLPQNELREKLSAKSPVKKWDGSGDLSYCKSAQLCREQAGGCRFGLD